MNQELLWKAFGDIDERFVAEAYRPLSAAAPAAPEKVVHLNRKRIITFALAAALLLSLGIAGWSAGKVLFGWGGNMEIRSERTDGGIENTVYVHTEDMTQPVRFEDGRMIFIVNGEELDITDQVSETQAFTYQYTDAEGITHGWLVGKNGPEPTNYGYGEYLASDKGWFTGYTARVNLDPDSDGPAWLRNGKAELGVTW